MGNASSAGGMPRMLNTLPLNNDGVRPVSPLPSDVWALDGTPGGRRLVYQDLAGKPGRWDVGNSLPMGPIQPSDPFSRVQLGLDVPGQETRMNRNPSARTDHGYVPVDNNARVLPGGNAESWVLFRKPTFFRNDNLLPVKTYSRFHPYNQ